MTNDITRIVVKDAKISSIEDALGETIEYILLDKRTVLEWTMEDIANYVSVGNIVVSTLEVAEWLEAMGAAPLQANVIQAPKEIDVPEPKKKSIGDSGFKVFGGKKSSATLCTDRCLMAAYCKYYERYYGKSCPVDMDAKRDFLEPINNYIEKTYSQDEDVQKVFSNLADQAATVHQLMRRKVRHMNMQGIMVTEKKVDPTSGKIIYNEVVNPLNKSILSDTKQIVGMLKELNLTPKSMPKSNAGGSDAASLSKAIDKAKEDTEVQRLEVDIKHERYISRPKITSKEQLLGMIEEKKIFQKAMEGTMSDVKRGVYVDSKDMGMAPISSENVSDEDDVVIEIQPQKKEEDVGDRREPVEVTIPQENPNTDVSIPLDVQAILNRVQKQVEEKKDNNE